MGLSVRGRGGKVTAFLMSFPRPTRALCLLSASLVVLALISAPVEAAAPSASVGVGRAHVHAAPLTTATGNPTKEIFGYASAFTLGDPNIGYPSWNFNLLSTVAFFSLHVQYNGTLGTDAGWGVWNSSTLTGLVNTAHAHGVKGVV